MAYHAIPGSSLSIEPKHAGKTHKIWNHKVNMVLLETLCYMWHYRYVSMAKLNGS